MTEQSRPAISETLASVGADGSRRAIHPADVRGRFLFWRRVTFVALVAFYLALPFIHVGGHPAVHLDIPGRHFFLFGASYNAQDFWMVVLLLLATAAMVLFVTAWLGRAWCGWACPQTVFLELLYRPVERLIDGPRERRLKLAGAGWTAGRMVKASLKHGTYLGFSLVIAHAALALFIPLERLTAMVLEGPAGHEVPFAWAMAFTSALYFNFAWFREQTCIIVCPYGRLQSALIDRDSLIVGYDDGRGEPRGRWVKADAARTGRLGDCVDCARCVQVCPTGIDIRDGLQLECIACAQCVDACDEVMDKVKRPRGLIRYDSLNGLAAQARRVLRPRLVGYGALLVLASAGAALALGGRDPFEVNLLRMQGAPYVLDGGEVRNQFQVHLVNKASTRSTLRLAVIRPPGARVVLPMPQLELDTLENAQVPLFVTLPLAQAAEQGEVELEVEDVASGTTRRYQAKFLSPPRPRG